jgi:hypothetical protein
VDAAKTRYVSVALRRPTRFACFFPSSERERPRARGRDSTCSWASRQTSPFGQPCDWTDSCSSRHRFGTSARESPSFHACSAQRRSAHVAVREKVRPANLSKTSHRPGVLAFPRSVPTTSHRAAPSLPSSWPPPARYRYDRHPRQQHGIYPRRTIAYCISDRGGFRVSSSADKLCAAYSPNSGSDGAGAGRLSLSASYSAG